MFVTWNQSIKKIWWGMNQEVEWVIWNVNILPVVDMIGLKVPVTSNVSWTWMHFWKDNKNNIFKNVSMRWTVAILACTVTGSDVINRKWHQRGHLHVNRASVTNNTEDEKMFLYIILSLFQRDGVRVQIYCFNKPQTRKFLVDVTSCFILSAPSSKENMKLLYVTKWVQTYQIL